MATSFENYYPDERHPLSVRQLKMAAFAASVPFLGSLVLYTRLLLSETSFAFTDLLVAATLLIASAAIMIVGRTLLGRIAATPVLCPPLPAEISLETDRIVDRVITRESEEGRLI